MKLCVAIIRVLWQWAQPCGPGHSRALQRPERAAAAGQEDAPHGCAEEVSQGKPTVGSSPARRWYVSMAGL